MKANAKIVSIEMTQKELHNFIGDYLRAYCASNDEKLPSDLFSGINEFIEGQLCSLELDGLVNVVGTIDEDE